MFYDSGEGGAPPHPPIIGHMQTKLAFLFFFLPSSEAYFGPRVFFSLSEESGAPRGFVSHSRRLTLASACAESKFVRAEWNDCLHLG